MANDGAPRVVVLRNNDYCFLGALRGLAGAGCDVIPVVWDWVGAGPWHSARSRHGRDPITIPNPFSDPVGAVDAFVELGTRLRLQNDEPVMVVPSSDTGLMFLLDHWERFSPFFRLMGDAAFADPRKDCAHKARVAERLASAGCPTPLTVGVTRLEDIEGAVRAMTFPCIYKPAVKDYGQSFYRTHGMLKAVECVDAESLRRALNREVSAGFDLVVQEKISFESTADEMPFYVYADASHEVRLAVGALKESIHPAPFGTATTLRLAWDEELLVAARGVVRALRWRGLLMIEFIRDPRDGVAKVIEINTRPWLMNDFFRQSGFDFLGALAADLRGELGRWPALTQPSSCSAAERHQHVDLLAEVTGRAAGGSRSPDLALVTEVLIDLDAGVTHAYDDPDDPEPGLARRRQLNQTLGMQDGHWLSKPGFHSGSSRPRVLGDL